MLLNCLTCHPMCEELITEFSDVTEKAREPVNVFINEEMPESDIERAETAGFEIPLTKEEILRRCAFFNREPRIPAKLSVTELVKNKLATEESEQLIKETPTNKSEMRKPKFMSETAELYGAEAGTAMHLFVSLANLSLPLEDELARLTGGKFIAENQANVIRKNSGKIRAFTESALYGKILASETVRKEEYFIARIPAAEFSPDADENAEIILQGAIDVLCEYADSLVIIDYKTDRASEEELVKRYAKQLEYYAYAAEKSFRKPVREMYIWSFHLCKAIKIESVGGTLND